MWERECLLLNFLTWRRYTKRQKRNVETVATCLGNKVILRYSLNRWRCMKRISMAEMNVKITTMRKRTNELHLMLHFCKWFDFSRSRGRRIRKLRKCWDDWFLHTHHQKQERILFSDVVKTIQLARKTAVLSQWQHASHDLVRRTNYQKQSKIQQYKTPKTLYLVSIWFHNCPKLVLTACWRMVSSYNAFPLQYAMK